MLCITVVHILSRKEGSGDAPTFQKEQSGQQVGALQGSMGMRMQQWTWLPWDLPPATPGLHIHFCFSHDFSLRCCCTGAPSSADNSYSDSLRQKNKYIDMEAAKSGNWICHGQPAFQNAKRSWLTYEKWDRSICSGMFCTMLVSLRCKREFFALFMPLGVCCLDG